MDSPTVMDVVAVDVAIRFGWYAIAAMGGGVVAVLGIIIFGKGYKKRIAALEAKESSEGITIHGDLHIVNNYYSADDRRHHTVVEGRGEIISPTPVRVRLGTHAMAAPSVSLTASKVKATPPVATDDERSQ